VALAALHCFAGAVNHVLHCSSRADRRIRRERVDAWVVESETKLRPAVNVDIRIHRLVLVDLPALSIPIQLPINT
jgi:hypothetical protein